MRSMAPLDLEEMLDPAWLTAALSERHPGVEVASVAVTETLQTIATKVRFRVEYWGDVPASVPRAFCVKGYFHPEFRSSAGGGQVEVRFYRDLAASLPIRVPPCVYTGIDEGTGHGIVVMEDLVAAGATFLTALSPYTADQAAATLDQLARLHASHWDGHAIDDVAWLAPRTRILTSYVTNERLQALLDDPRGDTLPPAIRSAGRARDALLALVDRASRSRSTLIHGDAHAGNLFLDAAGDPGLIDWQLAQQGSWAFDVAYHLGAVLAVEERERSERELLRHYLDRLRAYDVDAPSDEEAWEEYRVSLAYGYYLWAMTQRVDRPIIDAFVTRLGTAVASHGSFELLGV